MTPGFALLLLLFMSFTVGVIAGAIGMTVYYNMGKKDC